MFRLINEKMPNQKFVLSKSEALETNAQGEITVKDRLVADALASSGFKWVDEEKAEETTAKVEVQAAPKKFQRGKKQGGNQ
jgi:hypothetical protein